MRNSEGRTAFWVEGLDDLGLLVHRLVRLVCSHTTSVSAPVRRGGTGVRGEESSHNCP